MAEGFIDEIVDVVEDAFPHKPGGIIDRERENRARREAADAERLNMASRIEQVSAKAVKTAQQSPEVFSPQTFTIAAGGKAPVLSGYAYRYRSVILVITSNANVILCKDENAATGGIGFALPFGVPLPLFGRGQLWASNPSASVVQVSVIAENYGPES